MNVDAQQFMVFPAFMDETPWTLLFSLDSKWNDKASRVPEYLRARVARGLLVGGPPHTPIDIDVHYEPECPNIHRTDVSE